MLNLEESQYAALKLAITKEFAIIQGPPGTGKTFIGLRVIQLLLHNIKSWFHDKKYALPILIVCRTNHALDQFLEGVTRFTNHIVRIGGRRVSSKIEKFILQKLVEEAHIPKLVSNKISRIEAKIKELEKEIYRVKHWLEGSISSILNGNNLKSNIPYHQYKSLMDYVMDKRDASHPVKYIIYDWLKIWATNEEDDETEVDIMFTNNHLNSFKNTRVFKKDFSFGEHNDEVLFQIINDGLNHKRTLHRRRAFGIKNVWTLSISERWQLFKFWHSTYIQEMQNEFEDLQLTLKLAYQDLWHARIERDLHVIKSALVVGMTTTGAAKYRYLIENRNPVVVIVEEAAEILESHIITSLTPKTQHVILIGDQQQLQPSPSVYLLGTKYNMNISLFERMIMNGMDYCRLSVQHRMRPEIAALIVPHIYQNLENHKVVTEFENIKGIRENVFFVTHEFPESSVLNSNSKTNEHEARFVIELCRYLLLQGYVPSQITVLTTYSDQLSVLQNLATGALEKVRFTVVDNYQGEENEIVLISFVRSNMEGKVGFLKVPNRVNVALSRARKGLYCIGNFELLAKKSELWKGIVQTLENKKLIGPSLCLTCQNHPDVFTEVTKDTDFIAVIAGGCFGKCDYRFQWGHACDLSCHPLDTSHENFKFGKTSKKKHPCLKKCFEANETGKILVKQVLTGCRFSDKTSCGKDDSEIYSKIPCTLICKDGHLRSKVCFGTNSACKPLVEKTLTKCGHSVKVSCEKNDICIECTIMSSTTLQLKNLNINSPSNGTRCNRAMHKKLITNQNEEPSINRLGISKAIDKHSSGTMLGQNSRTLLTAEPCKQIGALKYTDIKSFQKSFIERKDESINKGEYKRKEENSTFGKQILRDFLQIPKDTRTSKIQGNSIKNENVTIEKVEPSRTEKCITSEKQPYLSGCRRILKKRLQKSSMKNKKETDENEEQKCIETKI